MISKFEQLDEVFNELDKALSGKVHFYVIGGAVMLYHGLKTATKDIDVEKMMKELKKCVFIEQKYLKQLYEVQSKRKTDKGRKGRS